MNKAHECSAWVCLDRAGWCSYNELMFDWKESHLKPSIKIVAAGLVACAVTSPLCLRAAETWPTRPLRFIFPFVAGSASEVAARAIAQRLSKTWNQQIVVDNRPGAGTIVGTDVLAKSPPDGHTFGWIITAHAINPALYPKLPYDTLRDFTGVTLLYQLKIIIVTAPNSPLNSVSELIALAKARPGQLTFASAAVGTGGHLLGELFKLKHSIDMQHIGYKGGPAAHPDVMSGRVSLMFDTLPGALPHIKGGRLKALAVVSDTPAAALPQLATLPGLLPAKAVTGWNGIVVPAGTPKTIVSRLNADMISAVKSPEIQEVFATLTVDTLTSTPQEFDAFIREEIIRWGDVVKRADIKLE